MFVFVFFSLLNFNFTVFTYWYSIKYLGNINWEVLLLAKLRKPHLPHNFLSHIELFLNSFHTSLMFLQWLDVSCLMFRAINRKWDKMLNDYVTTYGTRNHVDKSEFVDLLCKICHVGIKPENAISVFSSIGI